MYELARQSPEFFWRSSTAFSRSISWVLSMAAWAARRGMRARKRMVVRIFLLFMVLLSTEVGHGRHRTEPGGANGGIDGRHHADQGDEADGHQQGQGLDGQVQVIGHQEELHALGNGGLAA